jgi:hypothetical protein
MIYTLNVAFFEKRQYFLPYDNVEDVELFGHCLSNFKDITNTPASEVLAVIPR